MKTLNMVTINKVSEYRKKIVLQELINCKGKQENFNKYKILIEFNLFLDGLALGLNMKTSELESILNDYFIGSHDLNNWISYHNVKALYKTIKN